MDKKILVVDDDVVSRMLLMHLIDAHGRFDVIEAEDGEDARDKLEAGLRPEVVFCDLRMPRMSGIDLLRYMQASDELSRVPLVLVTAASDKETMSRASDYGAAGYLVKPFMPEQVGWFLPRPALAGQGREHAEVPVDTMQRLGINSERLLAYLGGLSSQLTGARAELGALFARGDIERVKARLHHLHTGCVTLGLLGAARAIDECCADPAGHAAVDEALALALAAAHRQGELARDMAGA